MTTTLFPEFFATAPSIATFDPLAEFLGAADSGLIEYRYGDAVRLAGHSCPTVASAFLMTRSALKALYHDRLPERGNLRIDFREPREAGVAGVMATIATLITGATDEGGFRGIGGRFNRRDLLRFGVGSLCSAPLVLIGKVGDVHRQRARRRRRRRRCRGSRRSRRRRWLGRRRRRGRDRRRNRRWRRRRRRQRRHQRGGAHGVYCAGSRAGQTMRGAVH